MQFYGTRLSDNISRRESTGALLCLNVPVARTGIQQYLPEELGLESGPGMIPVYRPEEEVFAPEAIASFEGMPVTNEHPSEEVDIRNIRRFQMGHAQNVRRGTGKESDLLLADLMITDPGLIDAILNGKREISCGYTYELFDENGHYIQRKIRGNHIAVVEAGRAGSRVSIKDHKRKEQGNTMKNPIIRKLVLKARAGDNEAIELLAEAAEEAIAEEAKNEEAVTLEVPEEHKILIDEDEFKTGMFERLDKIIELLGSTSAGDEDPEAPAETEEIAELIEEVVEETAETAEEKGTEEAAEEVAEIVEAILEPGVSSTIEEEDDEDDTEETCSNDALRAALHSAAPVLARMTQRERRKAAADIAARVKKSRAKSQNKGHDHGQGTRNQKDAAGEYNALGKMIMAKRNINYHG